jgi:hypothetical protein
MIPQHTLAALDRYINHRILPGGFLIKVLSNDLFGAVGQADRENLAALGDIVKYIYNELPGNAWGSSDLVYKWVESRFYQSLTDSQSTAI